MKPYLDRGVFRELKDVNYFNQGKRLAAPPMKQMEFVLLV